MKASSSHAANGIALLASVVVLAGCNQSGDNDNSQATGQPTSVVTKSSTATPSSESELASADSSSAIVESDEQDADSDGKTAVQQGKPQESCTDNIAAREYQDHAAEVPPPSSGEWDIDLSSFLENQPCAALSWAVLVPTYIVDGNPPTQTMLFHNGRFIKTVSQEPTYPPYIRRIDDSTINVTWDWPKPGEPQAAPTGRSVATFRWDDQSESVVMEGELPPD
ncbi:LppP/LprE family lipoprotein [Corynebacterium pseudokroppenstedtii]|uniref:LppP/LprE family lipoprotein n=1 Tax=Corynebacterium pseudokroppenstedtii TaxID=2804917 RepID=A0AAU0PXX5_9CORY|nr:LppP/LprE family lipoprotein [Corynebacterium pseudokroppenstedtii]QRP14535.1 LppP/LprE family lipoprotein [Corynebacterium kroppenstedtii]MBY0791267.1 LppP/LprE family lipoprotein [Corynebacterium pseudokroppenstedtii]MCF6793510.1 LppP/LprE family lipoprotein [Corynebacterium pseudokroppenstedtii]MCF8702861.1 LppP/LprE family lipoprotein [Corynebacterium pseudokroppenstedtii]MCG2636540.1 LppP/LprE family lipoprotein [Corynebacterium pseudokroppenstedtii]